MAQNVESVTLDVLKSIQTSIADMRASIEQRLDRLEASSARQRRDSAGMLVMMRSTVGHYAGELAELKARVEALEQRDSL